MRAVRGAMATWMMTVPTSNRLLRFTCERRKLVVAASKSQPRSSEFEYVRVQRVRNCPKYLPAQACPHRSVPKRRLVRVGWMGGRVDRPKVQVRLDRHCPKRMRSSVGRFAVQIGPTL
jgi:hypothetical protein